MVWLLENKEKIMKRKYADRPNWKRIIEKSYSSMYVDDENFCGHVAMIILHKVREPLWVQYGQQRLCIVDDGYVWLQHVPEQGGHVLTSTFSSEGELVQCYFDIVKYLMKMNWRKRILKGKFLKQITIMPRKKHCCLFSQ